jgi:hypothetical protein
VAPSPDPYPLGTGLPALRLMAVLKAAQDFGLAPSSAAAIGLAYDPARPRIDHIVDALAAALIDRGAVRVPDFV